MVVKANAIVAMTPAADHSTKQGYFVSNSSGSAAIVSSATALPMGVILDGETTSGKDSVALMNFGGTVHVKLSGTVSANDKLQLAADGTVVVDAASSARVLVAQALEAGVSGDLIEAALYGPIVYAS
jgi:hypothetical protein